MLNTKNKPQCTTVHIGDACCCPVKIANVGQKLNFFLLSPCHWCSKKCGLYLAIGTHYLWKGLVIAFYVGICSFLLLCSLSVRNLFFLLAQKRIGGLLFDCRRVPLGRAFFASPPGPPILKQRAIFCIGSYDPMDRTQLFCLFGGIGMVFSRGITYKFQQVFLCSSVLYRFSRKKSMGK